MRKTVGALIAAVILCPALYVHAETLQSPHTATFNSEIVMNTRYMEDGYTYFDIQDVAAFYDNYARFDGRKITVSAEPPASPAELRLCDANGILCVPRLDLQNLVNTFSKEFRFEYSYINGSGSHYSIVEADTGAVRCGVPFFRHKLIEILNDADFIADPSSDVPDSFASERDGATAFIPLDVYNKVVLSRYLMPQYTADGDTADILYNGEEYTLPVKNIDSKAYFKIRDLAEIFGFDVDFEDNTVKMRDKSVDTVVKPGTPAVYIVDGIRYLKWDETNEYLAALGWMVSRSYYELVTRTNYAGEIIQLDRIRPEESLPTDQIFDGYGVPYMYMGDRMLYYDFFAIKGLV